MKSVTPLFLLMSSLAVCFSAGAQDSENPPVIKLDRIPSAPAFAGQTRAPAAPMSTYKVESVVQGLSLPWALAFLPGGGMIINENSTGAMRILDSAGNLSATLAGLPEISHEGWSGLFDVAIDPAFEENHLVYFSYTVASGNPDSPASPRIARGELDIGHLRLDNVEVILEGSGQQEIHFAPDGMLLVAGAGGLDDAQDMSTYSGKMLRVNTDGSAPSDNPWLDLPGIPGELYTAGHRDISGYATHPETGDIWITEHGPRGGDELNLIRAGGNYGWNTISYGTNYSGEPVGDGHTTQDGMVQPRYFWRPSIAPSGLMFYTGDMFPEWQGNIFVTSLSGQHFTRLVLEGDRVVAEERFLVDRGERIRELRQGPDGALYALTNEEGDAPRGTAELLRISK